MKLTRETEMEIIRRILQGDTDAFELLVRQCQKNVYNLALKMTGNPDDAFDISQEAFLKAFRSLASFRGDSSFSVWLYRLTSNLSIDFIRREKKRKTTPLIFLDDDLSANELQIADWRFDPESSLEKKELSRLINQGLDALPVEHRHILVLREMNGLSYSEIAEVLGLEIGTVKSRIFRARSKLAKYLSALRNNPSDNSSNNKREGEQSS